ncbi:MAG TPA: hypothetical protein VHJ82_10250, partial [Actinomycetota bacterium]|nr:hypothetical protein [Actinomycetota bacterium]
MTARRTNFALLLALALAFATGVTAFGIGTGWNRWITVQHGIAGFLIIALAPWKSLIVRRGLARHRPGSWASIALLVLVVIAIVSGLLHSTGTATDIGGLSAMQIHVGAALVSLPFALWHVLKRSVRVTPMDFARRRLLRAGAFVGGAAVTYSATEGLIKVAGLPGASRRFTGSHERGS